MRTKKYSEELLQAFLECKSIREISEKTGLSKQMICRYREDRAFMDELSRRKLAAVQLAVNKLQSGLSDIVETVLEIASDETCSKQVRLNACQIALSQCKTWTEMTDIMQRLEAVEQAIEGEKLTGKGCDNEKVNVKIRST